MQLLARAAIGLHLTEPWQVVIAGPPNVGKSSLINAILGYQRAIVFDQPGTTRDVVTALTALDGWPIEFSDTAGLARAPIRSSWPAWSAPCGRPSADLLLLLFDVTQPWSTECQRLVDDWPAAIIVHSKCDLPPANILGKPRGLGTARPLGAGIDALTAEIVARLIAVELEPGDPIPFTAEQVEQLHAVLRSLHTADTDAAMRGLLAMLALM